MPKLWTTVWDTPPYFSIQRSYQWAFQVDWWPSNIIEADNPFILRETIYGGYGLYIRLQDKFWEWSSNTYTLDWCIEDIYGMLPGSSTPMDAGGYHANWGAIEGHHRCVMYIGAKVPGYQSFVWQNPAAPVPQWFPPEPPDS